MSPPQRRPIELEPGAPIADALTRGRQAFARADVAAADVAYREAVGLATGDPALWSALAIDHSAQLLTSQSGTLALRRCTEYLIQVGEDDVSLRLLRAEIRSDLGDHAGADTDAAAIRATVRSRPDIVTPDDSARLHRVEGLSAADRGDFSTAARHLGEARQIFDEIGDRRGAMAVDRDRIMIAVWQGDERAVPDALAGDPPQTVSDYLLRAVALKCQLRYEEAFQMLLAGAVDHDIDPAQRWHVLYELVLLLRLIRQDEAAGRLLPLLEEAVATSADPAAVAAALARLDTAGSSSDGVSPQFDRKIQHARRLVMQTRLEQAEAVLAEVCSLASTARDIATWHLAAGEVEFAKYQRSRNQSFAQDAAGHLSRAADHASTIGLAEVRAFALRLLGRVCAQLNAYDRAAQCWAEAHHLEELIAGRQITDNIRIGMLQAVSDEYDERIRVAAEARGDRDAEETAAIVVAMEAARGAMILGRIFPAYAGLTRELPGPSDLVGASRWVSGIADSLPRSQVAWIIHSTPDRLYHAVLGRGLLYYASIPSRRRELTNSIDELVACWSSQDILEASIAGGHFDARLDEVAARIGIKEVIFEIPPYVHRIAIVAGGELSDIPFAAITVPGETGPIGSRFALSDLPCLSAMRPLHRRSRRLRGDRLLRVTPPGDGLTRVAHGRAYTVLDGARATPAALRAELGRHRHRQVRIDSHGQHEYHDPAKSWLQLAPSGPEGRLRPEELQWMDLRGCGTVMLGACESGMAHRIGRDERIGFVRAAVHAGAPAVIAARWVAADAVAAIVLDRFERYARYLPRDVALQRAQLDVCRGVVGTPKNISSIEHPARWACWTLYGDSGWQTGAGSLRRSLRRYRDQRRADAARV